MKKQKMNRNLLPNILTSIALSCLLCFPQAAKSQPPETIPPAFAELEEGYVYGGLSTGEKYVVWMNTNLNIIYAADINTGTQKEIIMSRGRGPGEVQYIRDLAVSGDKVFILDDSNGKIVIIDLETERLSDVVLPIGTAFSFTANGNTVYLMDLINMTTLFYSFDLETQKLTAFENGSLDLQKEFDNPFFRQGTLLLNSGSIMLVTKFRPNMYSYSLVDVQFKNKTEYDRANAVKSDERRSGDTRVIAAPRGSELETKGAVLLRTYPGHLFLLAKGKGKERSYVTDALYQFELGSGTFIKQHELAVNADMIAAGGGYVFVYSEEEYKIYRIELQEN